jgi:hypothetical protein
MRQPSQFDTRTRQLLDAPIIPTLLRMAIPNALVMFAQLAIALVEMRWARFSAFSVSDMRCIASAKAQAE